MALFYGINRSPACNVHLAAPEQVYVQWLRKPETVTLPAHGVDKRVLRGAATEKVQEALQKPEIHFDSGLHSDGTTVFHARPELPLLNGFNGFLVETQAEGTHHFQVPGVAVFIDDHKKHYRALIFRFAGFFGILGFYFMQQAGRGNTAADLVRSATPTTTMPRTVAWPPPEPTPPPLPLPMPLP